MADPLAPTASREVLHRLLDAELAFSPVFHGMYSNHAAMALVALHRMGASAPVLRRALEDGEEESDPRTDGDDLDRLVSEVNRVGLDAVLAERAPAVADAPGTALFHPVIRLAYAIEADHRGQAAAALLDWGKRREPLPIGVSGRGRDRLSDAASALAAEVGGSWSPTFDLDSVARRPEVVHQVDRLARDEVTAEEILSFALGAHLAADHFITLHMVTGAHAVRTVAARLDPTIAQHLLASTAAMMVVAYAAVGAPTPLTVDELDALREGPAPDRESILERALADRDPHVIKLADVTLAEERRTGDRLWRCAAARVVGLVPSPR